MRKLIIALGGIAIFAGSTHAVNKANTGCGLGYVAMKDQEGLVFEVLAVTTNGTSANQTFGITFGTLECEKPSKVAVNDRVYTFISKNMDELAMDISRGEGPYLETLAVLMEVPDEQRTDFYKKLSSNFDRIFPDPSVSSAHVADVISTL